MNDFAGAISAAHGKRLVVAVIAIMLAVEAAATGLSIVRGGTGPLPSDIVRFSVAVILAVFLYRGSAWARYTMLAMIGLGIVTAVSVAVRIPPGRDWSLDFIGRSVVGLLVFYVLSFPASVHAHFSGSGPSAD